MPTDISPGEKYDYSDTLIEFYNPGHSLKDPADFAKPGSELRNTLVAPVFYDLGWAETKGTGFKTEILTLGKIGFPAAYWKNDERNDTFTITFPYPTEQVTPQVTGQVADQVEMRDRIAKILIFCKRPRFLKEMMQLVGLKHREYFLNQVLNPLLDRKYLKRTIPSKPTSRFQKYITVKKIR